MAVGKRSSGNRRSLAVLEKNVKEGSLFSGANGLNDLFEVSVHREWGTMFPLKSLVAPNGVGSS
jgi:hypothetical protein